MADVVRTLLAPTSSEGDDVPELDYAVLCDYVRADGGVAHIIAAGIDTMYVPQLPGGISFALAGRVLFARNECGRPHRLELIVQDDDGERLGQVEGSVVPEWPADHPVHWRVGFAIGINFGLPVSRLGMYSADVMLNDSQVKNIPFRVVDQAAPG